ncbi:MAG: sugar phosphate isomerase/epimerase [Chloroflexota bacterium]|nr:MAG: sugar phosphate isomerase/epimerase [Chloroflexota bacterium]
MKVGLYSITYLGVWYQGRALTPAEVVERAVSLGYDGVEIDGKRPHGNPMDWSANDRAAFRDLCAARGIEIVGVASNNDFASLVPEHREAQLLMVREQIGLCRDLGGKVVRLFFAWPGVTIDETGLASYEVARPLWNHISQFSTRQQKWVWVRESLKEAAMMAADAGITVALQNHTPLLRHYRDMLDMIGDVDMPSLRACLDVPILERQDNEYVRQAVMDTGKLQVHSHFGGEFRRGEDGSVRQHIFDFGRSRTNYVEFIRALRETGYDGYFCYEFCHPSVAGSHKPADLDYIDEQARLARDYLRDLLIAENAYTGARAAAAH